MKAFSGVQLCLRGLAVMLIALMCQMGTAHAAAVPANDPNVANQYNNDPMIKDTCNETVYNEEMNAKGEAVKAVQLAVRDNKSDLDAAKDGKGVNDILSQIYFCPLKITTLTNIIGTLSSMAAGMMAAIYAAVLAAIQSLINSLLSAICNAFMSALNSLVSLLCIPSLAINIKIPSFTFGSGAGASASCSGLSLLQVTGGPALPNPPLNYNTSIPGTNWQGRVSVIR